MKLKYAARALYLSMFLIMALGCGHNANDVKSITISYNEYSDQKNKRLAITNRDSIQLLIDKLNHRSRTIVKFLSKFSIDINFKDGNIVKYSSNGKCLRNDNSHEMYYLDEEFAGFK